MPRRTDEREQPASRPVEEPRGGALAPVDPAVALPARYSREAGTVAPSADGPAEPAPAEPRPAPARRMWTRVVAAVVGGAAAATLLTRAIVERTAGPLPTEPESFAAVFVLALIAAGMTIFELSPFLRARTPVEDELPRLRPGVGNLLTSVWVLVLGPLLLRGPWEKRHDLPDRDRSTPLSALQYRAAERPWHLQTQFALGDAYHAAGRFAEADAPLARARDLVGGEGFLHPTNEDLAQAEWKTRVQRLYALNHAHLLPPKQAYDYYSAAYVLGDRSKEVYRGMYEGLMARGGYREALSTVSEYIYTVHGDPEFVELAQVAAKAAWSQRSDVPAYQPAAARGVIPSRSPAEIAAERAAIEARLTPKERQSWTEARLGFLALQDAIASYSEKMDWRTGRMLASVGDGTALAEATRHTRRAIELSPRTAHYRLQLAMIQVLDADYKAAVASFESAEKADRQVYQHFSSYEHLYRFAKDRAAGGTAVQLLHIELVAPPPPGAMRRVP